MTLIKSISGIRGTIGGNTETNLTPLDIVRFTASYGTWLKKEYSATNLKVVIGRDARISGEMVHGLVSQTLVGLGIDVIDVGLSTTPTVEMAVILENANGGIVLTASHNPKQWNALKLLNHKGEFINAKAGETILELAKNEDFTFAEVENLGETKIVDDYIDRHIKEILKLDYVKLDAIKKMKLKVVVDGINSTGGIAVPKLLEQFDVEVVPLFCEPTGDFAHDPEPLEKNLTSISKAVKMYNADFGIVVDPDVDRLVFIDEKGVIFGEEYTLVACADYILSKEKGNTVSNLSSSRALRDITEKKYGMEYKASAVGEVNVVEMMKDVNAVIGGEGNGGIIYPKLHYGRDALVGIVFFLSLLAEKKIKVSELKKEYPHYFMSKMKMTLSDSVDIDLLLQKVAEKYNEEQINTIDGVKIDFENHWVHLRKSNTEPIIRIYSEALSQEKADKIATDLIKEIETLI